MATLAPFWRRAYYNEADENKRVVGYGAPGKGNTLLNYCAVRRDFLDYTVDRNPHKKGTYTPGTRIPIYDPSRIFELKPDYVLILPWNLSKELIDDGHQEVGLHVCRAHPECKSAGRVVWKPKRGETDYDCSFASRSSTIAA